MFMMPVASEVYSAGACVRGHLQRFILAYHFGLNFKDMGSSIESNSFLHRFLDELRPSLPVAFVAGALHTNEKTSRVSLKWGTCQQVFYDAIAKQGFGIGTHVLWTRHGIRP